MAVRDDRAVNAREATREDAEGEGKGDDEWDEHSGDARARQADNPREEEDVEAFEAARVLGEMPGQHNPPAHVEAEHDGHELESS